MRADFVDRSKRIFGKSETQHDKRVAEYKGLAKRSNIDPEQIILDMGLAEKEKDEAAPITQTIGGKSYIQRDGKWFEQ